METQPSTSQQGPSTQTEPTIQPAAAETADLVPLPSPAELAPSAILQQISGSGNIPISNPTGCTIYIYHSKDHVQKSGYPSLGIMENQSSTSQEPTTQPAAAQTPAPTSKCLQVGTSSCLKKVVGGFTLVLVILALLYRSTDYTFIFLPETLRSAIVLEIPDHVPTSQGSYHPYIGIMENQPSTSQEPATHPTTTQTPAQSAADSCEQAMKSHYGSTGSYVQTIPWVDDQKMHIMDIYTRLQLKTFDDKNKHKSQEGLAINPKSDLKLNSYEDIFDLKTREGDSINITVLSGLAGRGKSTLLDKMAYDWAVDSSRALGQFKLVFLLRMRALEQSSELIDAIFDQLLDQDTDVEKDALNSFIKKNPDKVLILLDGFDELKTTFFDENSFGSILNILNRKRFRGCFVVVTTRPSHLDRLITNQLVQKPFTHFRVLGFTAEDVEEYVHKFYSVEGDKLAELRLLERIQSSYTLSDLAKSPMLLLMMCLLWREDSTIPETMSRLYSEAVKYIFKRKVADASPEEISEIVIVLGKIGLHGLLSPDEVLSFKEAVFEKDIFDTAIKVGLLTRRRVLKGLDNHNSVWFIHRTFQEFCAAKYLQSLLGVDMVEFQKVLDQFMSTVPFDFRYLLYFCAGDNEECSQTILQFIQERFGKLKLLQSTGLQQMSLQLYFESQSEHLPPEEFIHSVISESTEFFFLYGDDLNSLTHFLKRVTDETKNTENVFFAKVEKLRFEKCDLNKYGVSLLYAINAMTNLRAVKVSQCHLNASSMKEMLKSLSNSVYLAELDFSDNEDLRGSAALWSHGIKSLKNLTSVYFEDCSLSGEDMQHITDSLHDLPKLVELGLSGSEIFSEALWSSLARLEHLQSLALSLSYYRDLHHCGSAAMWYDHLKHLKNLQRMYLPHCRLTGEELKHLTESLSELPNFVEFYLESNRDLGNRGELWAFNLKQLKNLKRLYLIDSMLTGEDLKHLTESLRELPNLVELSLSKNQHLRNSAELWYHNLKHLKSLQKLVMKSCSLTGEDVKYLAEALRHLPDLVDLNLSENKGLGGSVAMWSDQLKLLQNLHSLDLSGCSLTVEDVQQILESTSALPNFTELYLSSNQRLGGSAELWSVHLKHLKHLRKLHLGGCSLTGEDMKHITAALSDLPDLTELDLHYNKLLHGTAALWFHYLKNVKQLQKLNLSDCVTALDVKHISTSVSDLPKIEIIFLWFRKQAFPLSMYREHE